MKPQFFLQYAITVWNSKWMVHHLTMLFFEKIMILEPYYTSFYRKKNYDNVLTTYHAIFQKKLWLWNNIHTIHHFSKKIMTLGDTQMQVTFCLMVVTCRMKVLSCLTQISAKFSSFFSLTKNFSFGNFFSRFCTWKDFLFSKWNFSFCFSTTKFSFCHCLIYSFCH